MKARKSTNRSRPNVYSVMVVEQNNNFELLDVFTLKGVNQYKETWEKTQSRELARRMNKGKLVIK